MKKAWLCFVLAALVFCTFASLGFAETSLGTIGFELSGSLGPRDPENPDEDNSNQQAASSASQGSLTLVVVPSFNFGSGNAISNIANTEDPDFEDSYAAAYPALSRDVDVQSDAGTYDMPYIQVNDLRDGADGKWELRVKAGKFNTSFGANGSTVVVPLEGAAIKVKSSEWNTISAIKENATLAPYLAAGIAAGAVKIECDGQAASEVVIFKSTGLPSSVWIRKLYSPDILPMGNIDPDNPLENDTVQLYVKPNTVIPGQSYSSTITWMLVNSVTP